MSAAADTHVHVGGATDRQPLYEQPLPEVRLWLHVILQAQEYARGEVASAPGKDPAARARVRAAKTAQARAWIAGRGLERTCALLGLDADSIRQATYR